MNVRLIETAPSAYGYPLLIKNLLTPALRNVPHQEIVYRGEYRYTYRKFAERVAQLANVLKNLGIGAGKTVAIMDWDSHRYLECYFAVPMIGAILHTINIRLSPEQLLYTINHAGDDLIITHTDFIPLLNQIGHQFETDKKIIVAKDRGGESDDIENVGTYETLLADRSNTYRFPDFDENAAATIFYTTGTTGLPKGVSFSHRQIILHTYGFMSGLCAFHGFATVSSTDVYMPLTPMFHVHAWGMPYLFTMLGAKQIYVGRYEPEKILSLIASEGVTFSHCVPTILKMVLDDPLADTTDLSGWKVVIGGSAMSKGFCEAALARGINLFSAYGLSETCPLLTIAGPPPFMLEEKGDDLIDMRCRTGLPVPHVDLDIIDGQGHSLPHDGNHIGEVVARSPWLAQSYFREPEKSEHLWENGWLHTGDVGFIDPGGYLQITDRIKDVIKTGGEWISSLELEDIISSHEAVSEAAVIGVPNKKWGERPIALIVIKAGFEDAVSEAGFKEYFKRFADNGVIPKYGIPDRVMIVDTIAKTSVGKIDKKVLREKYDLNH